MRRGLIFHQSPPACTVKASRTTQDTVNQEDTQGHPQRAQANHTTATPPTPKAQTDTETNPNQSKTRQTMGENYWSGNIPPDSTLLILFRVDQNKEWKV